MERVFVFAPITECLGMGKLRIVKDCILFCAEVKELCHQMTSHFVYLVIHRKYGLLVSEFEHDLLIGHTLDKSKDYVIINNLDIVEIYKIEAIYNLYN